MTELSDNRDRLRLAIAQGEDLLRAYKSQGMESTLSYARLLALVNRSHRVLKCSPDSIHNKRILSLMEKLNKYFH